MVFVILIPIILLPLFLFCFYIYQRFFEGNSMFLFAGVLILILSVLIFLFYRLHWDEKLLLKTSKYALRFNEERAKNHLPPLTYDFVKDGMNWDTKLDSVND